MLKVAIGTLEDLVTCLLNKARSDARERASINAIRTTAIRIFENVYGDFWKKVVLDSVDVNDLFAQFKKNVRDNYSERTMKVYRARLRRAFDIYYAENKKIEDIQVATRDFEQQIRRLMIQINQVKKSFESTATHYLFTDEARGSYDIYAIPINGKKPIALAIPKTVNKLDAMMIRTMTERACSRINNMESSRM